MDNKTRAEKMREALERIERETRPNGSMADKAVNDIAKSALKDVGASDCECKECVAKNFPTPSPALSEQKSLDIIIGGWYSRIAYRKHHNGEVMTKDLQELASAISSAMPKRLSVGEIYSLLATTAIGNYQPIGEKGQPTPKPRPFYLKDLNAKDRNIKLLAKAIVTAQGGE